MLMVTNQNVLCGAHVAQMLTLFTSSHKFPSTHSEKSLMARKHNLANACLNPGHMATKFLLELKCKVTSYDGLFDKTTLHPPDVLQSVFVPLLPFNT